MINSSSHQNKKYKSIIFQALISTGFLFALAFLPAHLKAIGEYSAEYYADIEQPIDFNHKTHIDNGMACESCHTQARRSINSGTPSVMTCIGCHISIKGTTPAQQSEIAKINEYWKKGEPIFIALW